VRREPLLEACEIVASFLRDHVRATGYVCRTPVFRDQTGTDKRLQPGRHRLNRLSNLFCKLPRGQSRSLRGLREHHQELLMKAGSFDTATHDNLLAFDGCPGGSTGGQSRDSQQGENLRPDPANRSGGGRASGEERERAGSLAAVTTAADVTQDPSGRSRSARSASAGRVAFPAKDDTPHPWGESLVG